MIRFPGIPEDLFPRIPEMIFRKSFSRNSRERFPGRSFPENSRASFPAMIFPTIFFREIFSGNSRSPLCPSDPSSPPHSRVHALFLLASSASVERAPRERLAGIASRERLTGSPQGLAWTGSPPGPSSQARLAWRASRAFLASTSPQVCKAQFRPARAARASPRPRPRIRARPRHRPCRSEAVRGLKLPGGNRIKARQEF